MKYLCIALIRFYRRFLSPLKRHSTCRFTPTCSAYALEAYQKRGFFAGTVLTVWRILRCNPFCEGGYDPVPERGFRRTGEAPAGVSLYETDNEKDAGPSPARTETDACAGVPKNGKDSPG